MGMLRVLILATAALGATWAAERIARTAADVPGPMLAQADGEALPNAEGNAGQPDPAPPEQADAPGDPQSSPIELEDVSTEEIEAELARIEAAVDGAEEEEQVEFTPSKPLVADFAIALPSDI